MITSQDWKDSFNPFNPVKYTKARFKIGIIILPFIAIAIIIIATILELLNAFSSK